MRILSKFKDYYDGIGGYDTDPKRVYVRKTRELTPDHFPELIGILRKMPTFLKGKSYTSPTGVVAFCGKAYPYYHFDLPGVALGIGDPREKGLLHLYSFEAVLKFWKGLSEDPSPYNYGDRYANKENYKNLLDPKRDSLGGVIWRSSLREDSWQQFLENTNFEVKDEVFIRADAPVINLYRVNGSHFNFEAEANPRLNILDFAAVVDPYTTFQELEMFTGTVLVKQMNPNVHVSDEVKAESHGFNKFSFRKDPSKKKRGRT